VTALLRAGERFALVHIGDSRAYLLRGGVLSQVTSDHTFVQMLVDEGRITAEEAEHHPQRSVIMRVLGDVEASPELDASVHQTLAGDRWLLCSDGLSGIVSAETLAETLATVRDVGECADRLVQLALRGGGPDNITCIVADVVDDDRRPGPGGPTAPQVVGSAAVDRARASSASASPASRAAELGRTATTEEIPTSARAPGPGGPGASRGPRPRRWVVLGAVLAVAVLGAGALAVQAWLGRQYFVGASEGRVAIFSGLPQDVGPLHLSSVVSLEDMRLAALPPVYRQRVEATISATDLAHARRIVDDLGAQAAPLPGGGGLGTGTGTATPTATPTTAPTATPTTTPTTDPLATAAATATAAP
jgi:protein phosphatase